MHGEYHFGAGTLEDWSDLKMAGEIYIDRKPGAYDFAGDHPRLTEAQNEAMDMVDALAASDAFRFDMDFRPGDMQFLHNHQILHARTAYEDHADPAQKRHLLRLWLSARPGRQLPPGFAERYGPLDDGAARGGIRVPGVKPVVSLTP